MELLAIEMPLIYIILKALAYTVLWFSVATVVTGLAILASDVFYKHREE